MMMMIMIMMMMMLPLAGLLGFGLTNALVVCAWCSDNRPDGCDGVQLVQHPHRLMIMIMMIIIVMLMIMMMMMMMMVMAGGCGIGPVCLSFQYGSRMSCIDACRFYFLNLSASFTL